MTFSEYIPEPIRRHPVRTMAAAAGVFLWLKGCPDSTVKPEESVAAFTTSAETPKNNPDPINPDQGVRDFLQNILGGGVVEEEQPAEEPKDGLERCRQVIEQNEDILCTRETGAHMSCLYTGDAPPHLSVQIIDQNRIFFSGKDSEEEGGGNFEVYVGSAGKMMESEGADFEYPIPEAGDEDVGSCEAIQDILYNPQDYAELLCVAGRENSCNPESELGWAHHGLDLSRIMSDFVEDLEDVGVPFKQNGLKVEVELPEGNCELYAQAAWSIAEVDEPGRDIYHIVTKYSCPSGLGSFGFDEANDMTNYLLSGEYEP